MSTNQRNTRISENRRASKNTIISTDQRISRNPRNQRPQGTEGLGVSGFPFLSVPLPRRGNPLDNSFLRIFEDARVFRHIFCFILRQVTMVSRVPKNRNPLDNLFMRIFRNAEVFRHIFSFTLRQVATGSRVPGFPETETLTGFLILRNPIPNCSE
jgi:hypothetical protein